MVAGQSETELQSWQSRVTGILDATKDIQRRQKETRVCKESVFLKFCPRRGKQVDYKC